MPGRISKPRGPKRGLENLSRKISSAMPTTPSASDTVSEQVARLREEAEDSDSALLVAYSGLQVWIPLRSIVHDC